MDPRFGLPKIQYMWTDRDALRALQVRNAYDAERNTGKDFHQAMSALQGNKDLKWYVSPYGMYIPTFTQANPERLWDKLIVAGRTVELSLPEFRRKFDHEDKPRLALKRFRLWKKKQKIDIEWHRLQGPELAALKAAPTLAAGLKALHAMNPRRFPNAYYSAKATGFVEFVRKVFDFWGNTEYRYHATKSGTFDYANQDVCVPSLKPVIGDKHLEFVPASLPAITTSPVTPGKNKVVGTRSSDLDVHIDKLIDYANTLSRCNRYLNNFHSHQARCEAFARAFEAFDKAFPSLRTANPWRPPPLAGAALAARRLAGVTDEEAFVSARHAFTAPAGVSSSGFLAESSPDAPPLAAGLAAADNLLWLLTEDVEFSASAREWVAASLQSNRGFGHAQWVFNVIIGAIDSVRVVDEPLADKVATSWYDTLMAAPEDPVKSASELDENAGALLTILKYAGTRVGSWSTFVPATFGYFSGPPSLSVALTNAAGFLSARYLMSEHHIVQEWSGHWFASLRKLFDTNTAARIEEIVAAGDADQLKKYLALEFKAPAGVKIFGLSVRGTTVPAGNLQKAPWILGVVALFQFAAQLQVLFSLERQQGQVEKVIYSVNVALGSVQTVSIVSEAVLNVRALHRALRVTAIPHQWLQRTNIILAGATLLVGVAQSSYAAGEAWSKGGTSGEFWLHVTKACGHGVLLAMLLAPHPVFQALAMVGMLGLSVWETLGDAEEVELDGVVNNYLRHLAKALASAEESPLSPFLTDVDRKALDDVRAVCNHAEIRYVLAGQTIDPLGIVKADVQRFRQIGLSLVQISRVLDRVLSVEDLG